MKPITLFVTLFLCIALNSAFGEDKGSVRTRLVFKEPVEFEGVYASTGAATLTLFAARSIKLDPEEPDSIEFLDSILVAQMESNPPMTGTVDRRIEQLARPWLEGETERRGGGKIISVEERKGIVEMSVIWNREDNRVAVSFKMKDKAEPEVIGNKELFDEPISQKTTLEMNKELMAETMIKGE